jgi:aryl-alcohol dehydrogenase-like predicted oxidoreductase
LRALDDLVRQGKVRYIGCSTLSGWQVVEAQWTARYHGLHHFVSCQEEYSLLARRLDSEMMPMLQAYDLGLIPFAPLANGLLTGKYKRHRPPPEGARLTISSGPPTLPDRRQPAVVERLEGFARARPPLQARLVAGSAPTGRDVIASTPNRSSRTSMLWTGH